nr:hypothetical protein [uncultured Bacteroides sp.]
MEKLVLKVRYSLFITTRILNPNQKSKDKMKGMSDLAHETGHLESYMNGSVISIE